MLERISRTISDCYFLSEDFIDGLLKSLLSSITDAAICKELAERLHEERARLASLRPDVVFLKAAAEEAASKKSDSQTRGDRRRLPPYVRHSHYYGLPQPPSPAGRDQSSDKCNFCYRLGHWAADCPEKKQKAYVPV